MDQRLLRAKLGAGPQLTRRDFLGKGVQAGVTLTSLGAVLAACSDDGGEPSRPIPGGNTGAGFDITTEQVALEAAISLGGYGEDFWALVGDRLREEHPNLSVEIVADPNIWDQLQPRFVSGDVPDVAYPGWNADKSKLAQAGQLLQLDALLAAPAYGVDGKTFKDTLDPRTTLYSTWTDGSWYFLNLVEQGWGLWYNQAFFDERGWTLPTMWDEFLDLCEEIKARGIAPITFSGQYGYWQDGGYWALCYKLGGTQFTLDADNLVPGVWKRPESLEAMRMSIDLKNRGYFQKGWEGFDNIAANVEWVRGNAAFLATGTWVENEVFKELPEGFVIGGMPVPGVEGGAGDPTGIRTFFSESQVIPAETEHPNEAQEYYRIFFSPEFARTFAATTHDTMPVEGRLDGVELTAGMLATDQMRQDAAETWDFLLAQWYVPFYVEQGGPIFDALTEKISLEEFGDAMEELAATVREDDGIVKRVRPESPLEVAPEAT